MPPQTLYTHAGAVITADTTLRQTIRATVALRRLSSEAEKVDLHVRVRLGR